MKRPHQNFSGKVFLVGAGPGDPGLLTIKAKKLLQRAQIVFYDHLVNPEILKHAARAKRVHVGKTGYRSQASQRKIEQALIRAAAKYSHVVRLKGGDPFIFGRGGEEAEALRAVGIPFEVVPGVTSAIAVPAYAGIPLTHRRFGSSVSFVTGHETARKRGGGDLDWARLAREKTLVFLMGVKSLRENLKKLQKHGMASGTPAAIIEWGTYPRQRTVEGTVKTLPDLAERAGISSPAVAVVGAIVGLRQELRWFDRGAMAGKKLLLTRPKDPQDPLALLLREQGAEVLHFPTLEIGPPPSWAPVERALRRLQEYDWLLFTSVHGVKSFFRRFFSAGRSLKELKHLRTAAVGPATAEALREIGLPVSLIPEAFTSRDLGRALRRFGLKGEKVLFPRALEARPEIIRELRRQGAAVEVLPVYRSVMPRVSEKRRRTFLERNFPDLLVFTSGAAARNFRDMFRGSSDWTLLKKLPTAVIGPVTREAARQSGFGRCLMPKRHTLQDLALVIEVFFKNGGASR